MVATLLASILATFTFYCWMLTGSWQWLVITGGCAVVIIAEIYLIGKEDTGGA